MNDEDNIVKVDLKTETICCDGGEDSLGHPAVYYSFEDNKKIVCSYCGKIFIKKENCISFGRKCLPFIAFACRIQS